MSTQKASNPKEAFGSAKVPVGLVPDSAIAEESLAFLEGALKYGRYNWRIAGVRASTYNDAMERHRKRWWNGQDRDPVTRVRELASIRACCAILIDAELMGMLNDDRPPRADLNKLLDDCMDNVAHLKALFKDHSPKQYTIADSEPTEAQKVAANNGDEIPLIDEPVALRVYNAIADQRPEWVREDLARVVASVAHIRPPDESSHIGSFPCHAHNERFHCDTVVSGQGHPCLDPDVMRSRLAVPTIDRLS